MSYSVHVRDCKVNDVFHEVYAVVHETAGGLKTHSTWILQSDAEEEANTCNQISNSDGDFVGRRYWKAE